MGVTNSASNIAQSNSSTSNATLGLQAHEKLKDLTRSVNEALDSSNNEASVINTKIIDEEKNVTSSIYEGRTITEASSSTSLTSMKDSEQETSEASFIFTESTQNFTEANISNSIDTFNFASNTNNKY